jgi:hypothetical protein
MLQLPDPHAHTAISPLQGAVRRGSPMTLGPRATEVWAESFLGTLPTATTDVLLRNARERES